MADREFIAAKDLPVTEAEEVNVLVVDPATGELAQKAGANLGGGGIYTLNAVLYSHINSEYIEEYEIVGCSREDLILAAKDSKAIYNIVLKNTAEHNPYSSEQYLITTLTYDEDNDKICMICAGTGSYYYWKSDGTFEIFAD